MANLLMAFGADANHLRRALTVTASSADALFPVTAAYDQVPGRPFKWANATTPRVTVDLQRFGTAGVDEGTFEGGSGSSFPGWTNNGAVAREAVIVDGGASAVKLTGASASVRRNVTARAGERCRVEGRAHPAAGNQAGLIVYNPESNLTLQPDGTWGATFQACATSAGNGAYETVAKEFTAESFQALQTDETTLTCYLYHNSGGGNVYWDNAGFWPATDFGSVHGHNFLKVWAVKLQSSPDNAAWTDRLTFTTSVPSFWGKLSSPLYIRYWRLDLSGGASVTPVPWLGEFFLTQVSTMLTMYDYDSQVLHVQSQKRHVTETGAQQVYLLEEQRRRNLRLPFAYFTEARRQEAYDLVRRTALGGEPLVVVPHDGETPVIFGRVPAEFAETRELADLSTATLSVDEEPFPTWIS